MDEFAVGAWLEEPDLETRTRRERRRGRKVNEIMTLTARIVAQQGYHSTSVEEIADRLDLSKASIYHYFDGKEALVLATLESCASYVSEQLAEVANAEASATERLRWLIRRHLEIITTESVEISRLFLQPLDWPPSIRTAVREWQRQHGQIFRQVIKEGLSSGEFTCPNDRVANMAIQGAMNLVPSWFSRDLEGPNADPVFDEIISMLMLLVGTGANTCAQGFSSAKPERGANSGI